LCSQRRRIDSPLQTRHRVREDRLYWFYIIRADARDAQLIAVCDQQSLGVGDEASRLAALDPCEGPR
jgi:hypothetical protein